MKALLVADDEKAINNISEVLKSAGYDTIVYKWLLKALDNLEEIAPHLIIVSTGDYPRHWKTIAQYASSGFGDYTPQMILYTDENFSEEEQKKADALHIRGCFDSVEVDGLDKLREILKKTDDIFSGYLTEAEQAEISVDDLVPNAKKYVEAAIEEVPVEEEIVETEEPVEEEVLEETEIPVVAAEEETAETEEVIEEEKSSEGEEVIEEEDETAESLDESEEELLEEELSEEVEEEAVDEAQEDSDDETESLEETEAETLAEEELIEDEILEDSDLEETESSVEEITTEPELVEDSFDDLVTKFEETIEENPSQEYEEQTLEDIQEAEAEAQADEEAANRLEEIENDEKAADRLEEITGDEMAADKLEEIAENEDNEEVPTVNDIIREPFDESEQTELPGEEELKQLLSENDYAEEKNFEESENDDIIEESETENGENDMAEEKSIDDKLAEIMNANKADAKEKAEALKLDTGSSSVSFVFTNPVTLAMVSGVARNYNGLVLEFTPDIPSFILNLSPGTKIDIASMKVDGKIENVFAEVMSNDAKKLALAIKKIS